MKHNSDAWPAMTRKRLYKMFVTIYQIISQASSEDSIVPIVNNVHTQFFKIIAWSE